MTGNAAPTRSAARRSRDIASRAEAAPFPRLLVLAKAPYKFLAFARPERVWRVQCPPTPKLCRPLHNKTGGVDFHALPAIRRRPTQRFAAQPLAGPLVHVPKRANFSGERCPPKAEVVSSNLAGSATSIQVRPVLVVFWTAFRSSTHRSTHQIELD